MGACTSADCGQPPAPQPSRLTPATAAPPLSPPGSTRRRRQVPPPLPAAVVAPSHNTAACPPQQATDVQTAGDTLSRDPSGEITLFCPTKADAQEQEQDALDGMLDCTFPSMTKRTKTSCDHPSPSPFADCTLSDCPPSLLATERSHTAPVLRRHATSASVLNPKAPLLRTTYSNPATSLYQSLMSRDHALEQTLRESSDDFKMAVVAQRACVTAAIRCTSFVADKWSRKDRMELYAWYKQATAGDAPHLSPKDPTTGADLPKAGSAHQAWAAWAQLKGKGKEEAEQGYIAKVATLGVRW